MTSATHDTDLVIIGAGPAGLYGAYYAGFRGMKVTVVDSLPELGGQDGGGLMHLDEHHREKPMC